MEQSDQQLAPAAFLILFALATGEKHGYAIMQEARKLSDDYVSTEHLLLALSAHPGRAGDAMRAAGAMHERLLAALAAASIIG